jgi:hypothetical protein
VLEVRVLAGQDRLSQGRCDVVVPNDDAPLDGEFADDLPVAREHAGDRVGLVAVEGADLGKIVGVGEQDAAQRAEQRRHDKEDDKTGLPGDTDDDAAFGHVLLHLTARRAGGSRIRLTGIHSDLIIREA